MSHTTRVLALGFLFACGGPPPEAPPDLTDGGIVQWYRIEARQCGRVDPPVMWKAELSGRKGISITATTKIDPEVQSCMTAWFKGLTFNDDGPRTIAFGFMPGSTRKKL